MNLLHQLRRHCVSHNLLRPEGRLLLAVSGGMDSCVLLDLFDQLRTEWPLQLAVAHVNHQLRGSESEDDEKFVQALAREKGLPFYAERIDVAPWAQKHKHSLETAGREWRYRILEKFRQAFQARAIVTAHTLDDQAETILAHLLRGAGLAGLAGMAAQSDLILNGDPEVFSQGKKNVFQEAVFSSEDQPLRGQLRTRQLRTQILRPLLPFSRAQIEDYAKSRSLHWREDRSNADTQFQRNRIRHELLPLVKTRFNPQINLSLAHLGGVAAAAEAYLRAEAQARFPEIIKERQSTKIILDLELFWKYFPIIRRYVIRELLQELLQQPVEPSFNETARLLDLLQQPPAGKTSTGKRYFWRRQVEVHIDREGAIFEKQTARQSAKSFSAPVTMGERCEIHGTEFSILIERKALPPDWRQQVNDYSQFVDAEKVRGELRVRFPRRGDRFVPLRANAPAGWAGGSKKISDFFTDLKVPLHRRQTTPILAGEEIIWVGGFRLDDRFKITPATQTVLHLQLLPLNKQNQKPDEQAYATRNTTNGKGRNVNHFVGRLAPHHG